MFIRQLRHHSSSSFYRRSTLPLGIPLSRILTNSFPLSLQESFKDFWKRDQIESFQNELMSSLPFYPHGDDSRVSEFIKTPIDDAGNYINEFVIYPRRVNSSSTQVDLNNDQNMKHLVLIHGYGAGLGFYLKNFDAISEFGCSNNWCIHAIDLLGYGASSRPKFPTHLQKLSSLENWFIESLKTWFDKKNLSSLNTMLLLHSLGGYISARTNMKHPNLFSKLILVSPLLISSPEPAPTIPQWFKLLWEQNISPFSLVRYSGPLGSYFVSGWSSRRFSKLSKVEQSLLHKYAYGIFNAKGSGEYILNYVLAPGGVPRFPLINKIHDIKCDLLWLYGEDDWMDLKGGKLANDVVNQRTIFKSDYKIIPNSGHHIYMDNHTDFNNTIIELMKSFNS